MSWEVWSQVDFYRNKEEWKEPHVANVINRVNEKKFWTALKNYRINIWQILALVVLQRAGQLLLLLCINFAKGCYTSKNKVL